MSSESSEPDLDALANAVAERLEPGAYGDKMLLSRRQLLALAGAGVSAGALGTLGVTEAEAQSVVGQVGTDQERVDVYGGEGDFQSVSADRVSIGPNERDWGEQIDVFAIGGQSNAVGVGDETTSPDVKGETAYEYISGDSVVKLDDPLEVGTQGSAWPAFAKEYYRRTGRLAVYVQSADGGSSQTDQANVNGSTWDDTGTLRGDLVTKTQNAITYLQNQGYDPDFRGILWHQGETDAQEYDLGNVTKTQYTDAFKTMVDYFNGQFSTDWNLFLFQLGQPNTGDTTGFETIRDAQKTVVEDREIVKFVSGIQKSFPARGWHTNDLHYNQTGLDAMGNEGASRVSSDLARAPDGFGKGYQTSSQSIPDSTFTDVAIDTVHDEDPAVEVDLTNDQLVVKQAGVYQIMARATLENLTNSNRMVSRIVVNAGSHDYDETVGNGTLASTENSFPLRMEYNDTISLEVFQNSGSSQTMRAVRDRTYLSAALIRD